MIKNILIVDDSLTALEINKRCIEIVCQEYFENKYHFCKNGKEALDLLKIKEIDLIFSDIVMPVMNGEELAQKINQIPMLKKIPLIIVSSKLDHTTRSSLLTSGVKHIIRKPISPIKVKEALYAINFIEKKNEYNIFKDL